MTLHFFRQQMLKYWFIPIEDTLNDRPLLGVKTYVIKNDLCNFIIFSVQVVHVYI